MVLRQEQVELVATVQEQLIAHLLMLVLRLELTVLLLKLARLKDLVNQLDFQLVHLVIKQERLTQ